MSSSKKSWEENRERGRKGDGNKQGRGKETWINKEREGDGNKQRKGGSESEKNRNGRLKKNNGISKITRQTG